MNSHSEPLVPDTCATARELLPLHVGGDLEPLEAQLVDQHLVSCAQCRVAAERLASARQHFFEVGLSSAADELARRGLWAGIEAILERDRQADGQATPAGDSPRPEPRRRPGNKERRDEMRSRAERQEQARREQAPLDDAELSATNGARADISVTGVTRSSLTAAGSVELGNFKAAGRAAPSQGRTSSLVKGTLAWLTDASYPGRRAVRLMASAVVVTAAALLVALIVSDVPPSQTGERGLGSDLTADLESDRGGADLQGEANHGSDALAGSHMLQAVEGAADLEGSGFERLGPGDDARRLVLQPRELEGGTLRGGREALVGYPTWR